VKGGRTENLREEKEGKRNRQDLLERGRERKKKKKRSSISYPEVRGGTGTRR